MRRTEIYRYNPRECPSEELRETFVARQETLEEVLGVLRHRKKARANQHFLITGPRGIGKTNLLLMIRDSIRRDEELSEAYLPIQTAEEEYSVAGLRDLFARIIDLLLESAVDDALSDARESVLEEQEDDHAAEIGIEAVREYAGREGKRVVLLVDNLDLILGGQLTDDAEMGRLRDLLMNQTFLVLIGAAPTYFQEVSGYDRPFYNFFRHVELGDLTPEQVSDLLRLRAELDDDEDLVGRLEKMGPRIRAIHHLTGGNPRLVLILYQLCSAGEVPEIRTAIHTLLDEITPYYKHRLEGLAPQPRRLMDTFAKLGRPATPTELAAEARIPAKQVTSILNRLRESGFVSLAPQERRKKTYYMVSERVFRIWHQMRFSTSRRRLQFLIEFFRMWFTPEALRSERTKLLESYCHSWAEGAVREATAHLDHLEHLAYAAPSRSERYGTMDETVAACIDSGDFEHALEILSDQREEARREGDDAREAEVWFQSAGLRHKQKRQDLEIDALKRVLALRADHHGALICLGNALLDLARRKEGEEQEALFRESFERYRAAVEVKPDKHEALYNWGNALLDLARRKEGEEQEALFRESFERYRAAVEVKPDKHEALYDWGTALLELARRKEGEEQEALFRDSAAKARAAAGYASSAADRSFCSAHLVHIEITRAALAARARNPGRAMECLRSALQASREADPSRTAAELVRLFSEISRPELAELGAEFLGEMAAQGLEREVGLLEPFARAIEHWRKGRDMEVLDRLNPEVREIVKEIIRRGEEDRPQRALPLRQR